MDDETWKLSGSWKCNRCGASFYTGELAEHHVDWHDWVDIRDTAVKLHSRRYDSIEDAVEAAKDIHARIQKFYPEPKWENK